MPDYYHVATESGNPAAAPEATTIKRLLSAGHDLLDQGLQPSEVEQRVFYGLTATTLRASIFRAAIGISAPLSQEKASNAAGALGRALRGAPDLVFQRQFCLARLRGALVQNAHDSAEELRRDNIEVTAENLRSALMFAVVYVRPQSQLIPWHLANSEEMIEAAVNDYLGEF